MLECDYVVTGDTALMHLAFGLKRPTLVLFTYTRPEMVAPDDAPCIGCFVENASGEMYRGKLAGSVDVPVELAIERFGDLVKLAGAVSGLDRYDPRRSRHWKQRTEGAPTTM